MQKKYFFTLLIIIVFISNCQLYSQSHAGKIMPIEGDYKQGKPSNSNSQGASQANTQSLQEEKVYSFGYSFTQKAQLLTNEQRAQFPDGYMKEKILYISNIVEAIKNSKQFWNPQTDDIPWLGFFSHISKTGTNYDYQARTFGWHDFQTVNHKRNALISDFQQKGFRVVYITNFYYNQKERITSAEIKQSPQVENKQLQLIAGGIKSAGKETEVTNASSPSKDNDDFWNTPENTTTKQEIREKEAQKLKEEEEQRQEELRAEAREREEALLNPYVLNGIADSDTVYENNMKLIQSLKPVLKNAIVTISWTDTKTNQSTTLTGLDQQVTLNEGWNKFNIVVWDSNKPLKSSVRLFYKKDGRKIIFFDDFKSGNIISNWTIVNERKKEFKVTNNSDQLDISFDPIYDGTYRDKEYRPTYVNSRNFAINLDKKVIYEIKYKFNYESRRWVDWNNTISEQNKCEFLFYLDESNIITHAYDKKGLKDTYYSYVKLCSARGLFAVSNNEWINEKIICDPNKKTAFIYINDQLATNGCYLPKEYSSFRFMFNFVQNYGSVIFDYIKIYQE